MIYVVCVILVIHQGIVIDVILDIKGVLIVFGVFNLDEIYEVLDIYNVYKV